MFTNLHKLKQATRLKKILVCKKRNPHLLPNSLLYEQKERLTIHAHNDISPLCEFCPTPRYTGTPYIVSIVVLSACIFRQEDWRSDDVNFIFLAALLTFAFLSCMAKSACVLCRVMRPNSHGSMDVTSVSFRRPPPPEDEGRYLLK